MSLRETGLLTLRIINHLLPLHLFFTSVQKLRGSSHLFLLKTVLRGRTEGRIRM